MMDLILNDNEVTFKALEQNIFRIMCEQAILYTKAVLEEYDKLLMESRDKKKYRHKGLRKTTIKTVYGEVEYSRVLYKYTKEDGLKGFTYLLDEALSLEKIGLVSSNLAESIVSNVTELSYRASAKNISEMTGQSISGMGAWNVIQSLGKKVCEDERKLVTAHKEGLIQGEKIAPVLFEEMDGIVLSMQRMGKKVKGAKAEMKVSLTYEGWREISKDRYALEGKVITAGFSEAKEFQTCREAMIASEYNLDETQLRLLGGDSAPWIRGVQDKETEFQLDPYHRNQKIKERIPYKKAQRDIFSILRSCDIDELFSYLEIYKNSLSDAIEIENAEKLIAYFERNRDGLLPYQSRILNMPENKKGLIYRNMGTMENHTWSIIAKRMKNNHTSWSIPGGNNLAKILAKKCSGKLNEVFERIHIPEAVVEEELEVKIPLREIKRRIGKGYEYPVSGHLVGLDRGTKGDGVILKRIAGV
jgi:hypothetical protein